MEQSLLKEFENRCTEDNPPACTAACPFHMDARAFAERIQEGEWRKARELMEKSLPFAPLMSLLCDRPCEGVCPRKDLGGPVALGELEFTCLENTPPGAAKTRLPAKGKNATVLGCGLAGMAAAWELALKGYGVTLFYKGGEPEYALGSRLRRNLPRALPDNKLRERLREAIHSLRKLGVNFSPAENMATLAILRKSHDALFVDVEDFSSLTPPESEIDTRTGCLGDDYTIAFGGFSASSSMRAFEGRRGAITLIRMLGGSSPLAMREQEGPHDTRLHVDLSEVTPALRLAAGPDGMSQQQASLEAGRCLRCRCLRCVRSCEYLREYGDYPKLQARKMFVNLGIYTGYRHANKQINSCALCGQCASLCPEEFSMAELCLLMRKEMVKQGKMPPSAHAFALRELESSTSDDCTLAAGTSENETCAEVFFPGCQLAAARPNQVRLVFRHLRQNLNASTGIWMRCCGIPAHFAGRDDLAEGQRRALAEQWEKLGRPRIIAACASCLRFFRDYLPEIPVTSLWQVLDAEAPLPGAAQKRPIPLSLHDPCSARHDKGWLGAVRSLLGKYGMPYTEPRDTAETTSCCGYGGLAWNANPDLAARMTQKLAGNLISTALTSCIMCRDRLAETGKEALHLFDLLLPPESALPEWLDANAPDTPLVGILNGKEAQGAGLDEAALLPGPGFSMRREARARLKEAFRTKEYGLPPATQANELGGEPFSIFAEPDLLRQLEKKHILLQDMAETIREAEEKGARFRTEDGGRYLASSRRGGATFWVLYKERGDTREVLDAYYHRMLVTEA